MDLYVIAETSDDAARIAKVQVDQVWPRVIEGTMTVDRIGVRLLRPSR